MIKYFLVVLCFIACTITPIPSYPSRNCFYIEPGIIQCRGEAGVREYIWIRGRFYGSVWSDGYWRKL